MANISSSKSPFKNTVLTSILCTFYLKIVAIAIKILMVEFEQQENKYQNNLTLPFVCNPWPSTLLWIYQLSHQFLIFFLKTHLHPISLQPLRKSTNSQISLDLVDSNLELITSFQKFASIDFVASTYVLESSLVIKDVIKYGQIWSQFKLYCFFLTSDDVVFFLIIWLLNRRDSFIEKTFSKNSEFLVSIIWFDSKTKNLYTALFKP